MLLIGNRHDPRIKPHGPIEIDFGHPLARGLHAYYAWTTSAREPEKVRGNAAAASATGGSGGFSLLPYPRGCVIGTPGDFTDGPSYAGLSVAPGTTDPFTYAMACDIGYKTFPQLGQVMETTGGRLTRFVGDGANNINGCMMDSGGTERIIGTVIAAAAANGYYLLGTSWFSGNAYAWSNGSQAASLAMANHRASGSSIDFTMFRVKIYWSALWKMHALTAEEWAWLYQEPFAFTRPVVQRRYFLSSGAAGITGTLAVTLDDTALAATGTVDVQGSAAVTLDDATLAGTGAVLVQGTLGVTLDDATLAGTGVVGNPPISGDLNVTLEDAVLAAAGTVLVAGVLAATLEDCTVAGTGTVGVGAPTGGYTFAPGARARTFTVPRRA